VCVWGGQSRLIHHGKLSLPSPGLWQRDSPQYQALSVPEHSQPGTVVGNVTGAVDADEGSNAIVYYFIAGEMGTQHG